MDFEYYTYDHPGQDSALLHSETAPENARVGVLGGESVYQNDPEYRYPFVELVGPNARFPVSGNPGLRLRLGFSNVCVAESAPLIFEGDFQHVVISFDNGVYTIYKNGVLQQTLPLPAGCQKPASINYISNALIGRSREAYKASTDKIREVRLHTRPTTPARIFRRPWIWPALCMVLPQSPSG
jgi:hypothetical protein